MFHGSCYRLLQVVFSCAALAIVCDANQAANRFMDTALASMKLLAPQNGIDPTQTYVFRIKVKAAGRGFLGLTNRDFKANFTKVSLHGLGSLQRVGDCSYGISRKLMKLGCYVSLKSAYFLMDADVRGDSYSSNVHSISTNSTVSPNTVALVEVVGAKGDQASFNGFHFKPITMTMKVIEGELGLSGKRLAEFSKKTIEILSSQLLRAMWSLYAHTLTTVLSKMSMP